MNIQVRLGRFSDISQILKIRRKTFLHFAPSTYSPEEIHTLIEDVQIPELEKMIKNRCLLVAEQNQQVVGCGGWLDDFVRHVYVSPDQTKKGIGSALLRMVEADYKNRTNNPVIKAGVVLYAKPFYEKNGYEFITMDTDWDGSKFNRMQKRLF